MESWIYRGADKSLARPGREQANVSVRMAWISFVALPYRGKKTWWQLASRCCWNRARPWLASEVVLFLVGLRTYQHPGIWTRNVKSNIRGWDMNRRTRQGWLRCVTFWHVDCERTASGFARFCVFIEAKIHTVIFRIITPHILTGWGTKV